MKRLLTAQHTASAARWRTALPATLLALVLFVGLSSVTPNLATSQNLLNLANQQVSLVAVVAGQTLVVLTGGLDLSVGAVVSLSTAVVSLDLPYGLSIPLALLAAMTIGYINAWGITRWQVHPILMTLSTMTATQGVALLLRPIPGGVTPPLLLAYANATWLGLPLPVWAAWLVLLAACLLLHGSRLGLHLYAVGGSATHAELSGVNTQRTLTLAYVLCALGAGLGGVNLAARIGGGDPLVGMPFATDSVAAVALGGTLLSGGMGTMPGPMAGLAVLALLGNGLNFWNVSAYYQMVLKGALLVLAVSLHRRSTIGL